MKKILIALLACSCVILAGCGKESGDANVGGKLDAFAQCLTDKGLKMYGTNSCSHCQNMKASFGSAFAKINFINCEEQEVQCNAAGIEAYPTRSFNGDKVLGERTHEELAKIVGCEAALPGATAQ